MAKSLFTTICLLIGLYPAADQIVISAFADDSDDVRFSHSRSISIVAHSTLFDGYEDETQIPFSATIYLLPESAVEILKNKGFALTDEEGVRLTDEQAYLDAVAYSLGHKDDESILLGFLIREAFEEAKQIKFKTGADGRGKVVIKSGSYYLFAAEQVDDEVFVWHFPVNLYYSGNNSIDIDQHNAAAVISIE